MRLLVKNIKRLILLLSCIPWIRKLKAIRKKRAIVKLDKLTNFEFACNENLSLISSMAESGLIYMGRFGGVKHHFLCVDRKRFFNKLETIKNKAFINYGNRKFLKKWAYRFVLKHNYKKSGFIDVYKSFLNRNYIEVFGRNESVRISFPVKLGSEYILPRVNPVLRRFNYDQETLQETIISGFKFLTFHRFAKYLEHNPLRDKKIDLVYTWVDGFDHEWNKRKKEFDNKINLDELHESAISKNRFYHINELLYSIRSALTYTNFVRKIFIVTDQQVPAWLQDNDIVKVVDHRDIFPDISVLPTFNSHAIETCLHRIPELSEHYLYLNDDIIFARSVTLHGFFTEHYYPKINYSNHAFIPDGKATSEDLPVDSAAKNAREFFLKTRNVWITRKFKHVPCPVNKNLIEKLETEMQDLVDKTRRSRFRSFEDISFVNCAYYHWARIVNKYELGNIKYAYFNINQVYDAVRLYMRLSNSPNKRWHTFCLNDVDGELNEKARKIAQRALEMHYCEPCGAEVIV